MHQLDIDVVCRWRHVNGYHAPGAVNIVCPYTDCRQRGTFSLENHSYDSTRETVAGSGNCPTCGNKVHIWLTRPGPANDVSRERDGVLSMFPLPIMPRTPVPGSETLPERVRTAYHTALEVYNKCVWCATPAQIRRALEGLLTTLLPEEARGGSLHSQVEKLAKLDLSKPLIDLSHSLREGGNLGAHFDDEKDPDPEMVRAMLNLLDYLIGYLYTLPKMIEELNAWFIDKEQQAEDSNKD